jgi:hypothetical protein
VKEVLKIAGLNNLWTMVDTREEGLKSLGVKVRRERTSNPAVGLVLGVLGLMGAIAGLLVAVYSPNTLPRGLWSTCAGRGLNRALGILITIAAAALITVQILKQTNVM